MGNGWTFDGVKRVHVTSDVRLEILEGRSLPYRLENQASMSFVTPVECTELRNLRIHQACADRAEPTAPGHLELHGPKPPGTTELEKLTDSRAQTKRINQLGRSRNDPAAWSELANAVRVRRIRGPVLQVLSQIGWTKIDMLVASTTREGWPPELLAWIEKNRALARRPRPTEDVARAQRDGEYGFNPGD